MSKQRYKSLRAFVDAQPRGKTTEAIAADLDVTTASLYAWLSGARVPNREVALRLSRDFGISLEGLLDPSAREVA